MITKDDLEVAFDEVYQRLDSSGLSSARAIAEHLDEVYEEAEDDDLEPHEQHALLVTELDEMISWAKDARDRLKEAA